MILKYKIDGSWNFKDGIHSVHQTTHAFDECLKKFKEEGIPSEKCITVDVEILEDVIIPTPNVFNDVFLYVSCLPIDAPDFNREAVHSVNGINEDCAWKYVNRVLARLKDDREFDVIELITTQDCYLLNDNGSTIEKL